MPVDDACAYLPACKGLFRSAVHPESGGHRLCQVAGSVHGSDIPVGASERMASSVILRLSYKLFLARLHLGSPGHIRRAADGVLDGTLRDLAGFDHILRGGGMMRLGMPDNWMMCGLSAICR